MKKSKQKTMVYLPGVFDLFHIGHLNAIKQAKKAGEFLLVGVQSDKSVLEQKKYSPIISMFKRKAILRALRLVDRVIHYHHPDQSKILSKYPVNVLAVNHDYGKTDNHQKATMNTAKKLGIKIRRITYTQGISTTYLKNAIKWTWTTKK